MTSLLSNPLNPRRPALAPADSGSIPLTRAFDSFTPAFDSFARANPSMTSLNESIARAKQLTSFQSNHPLAGASASMTHVIDAVTLASQLTPFETDARCPVDPPLLTAAESITVPQSQGGRGGSTTSGLIEDRNAARDAFSPPSSSRRQPAPEPVAKSASRSAPSLTKA